MPRQQYLAEFFDHVRLDSLALSHTGVFAERT